MEVRKALSLKGKFIVTGKIKAKTGLHIGGSGGKLEIGGVDNVIIRDPITNKPYIPGSSLKGKMRSLVERAKNKELAKVVKEPLIRIHLCDKKNPNPCEVCRVFGAPGDYEKEFPSLLTVRDAFLDEKIEVGGEEKSWEEVEGNTDLPYSEVKAENTIDRITAQANPRFLERVPAGSRFNFELIFDYYEGIVLSTDFKLVFEALSLLEDDYLGGCGTRGSGKVAIEIESIKWKEISVYEKGEDGREIIKGSLKPKEVIQKIEKIIQNCEANDDRTG
ncbi:MAG: type III-A CRISPR-associated RAMP protein Csm3 [Acidobacteria bacterium]|nr:type III-A CRISPR-associated RAMP protein Csm3 [Acidobacteriota bacterium]